MTQPQKLISTLLLCSVLPALFLGSGCAAVQTRQTGVYYDRAHSFSLVLPTDWRQTDPIGRNAIAAFVPEQHEDSALLTVNIMELQPEQAERLARMRNARGFCTLLSLGILSTKLGKVTNRKMVDIDGSAGCEIEVIGKLANIKSRTLITVLLSRQRIVSLSFATKEELFPGYVEEVRSILRSFHDFKVHPAQRSI